MNIANQSVLDPAGQQASQIGHLWWMFFYVTAAIYVVVLVLTMVAALRRRSSERASAAIVSPEATGERRMTRCVGGAVGLSVIILFALMFSDFFTGRAMHALDDSAPLSIEVTAHQWWWEVKYQDPIPSNSVVTANEIHVPVGKAVQIHLKATDVIHSFWAPNLHGKKDAIPGHPTTFWVRATKAGEYRGQCAEYCGYQHAHMRFVFVADSPDQFAAWREAQSQHAPAPSSDQQTKGQQVFLHTTCVMCHTISGTDANATVGPTLTHIGSRRFIGAASFENSPATLRAWIADAHQLKPGVRMPQNTLAPEDLDALVTYLGSLK